MVDRLGAVMSDTDGFTGPLFKRLTPTDAGEKAAKVSGPTLLEDIRDFFPAPSGPKDHIPVRVILVEDAGATPAPVSQGVATIQIQGSNGKSHETILSDINDLRSKCQSDDFLLFEPSSTESDLYRVTRVAPASPRFASVLARSQGKRVGLLQDGILPRDRIRGFLRARSDDGHLLIGNFTIDGLWPEVEVTFESGDGNGRNTDYRRTVEVVLQRLAALDGVLTAARITSKNVAKSGVNPSFDMARFPFPVNLTGTDFVKLRKTLGSDGGKVDSPPGTSGNTTRRMTLSVRLDSPAIGVRDLEEHLCGCRLPALRDGQGPVTAKAPQLPVYALEEDLAAVDAAWSVWIAALNETSRPYAGGRRWNDAEAIMFSASPSKKRPDVTDIRLGVHEAGPPWAVEINAPKAAADANGLSTVARDPDGRPVLLRQAWLQANPDSDGEIRDQKFRDLTGLVPLAVTGGTTPTPRQWHLVAFLDEVPAEIVASTADFVHRCAAARAATLGDALPPGPAPSLAASPEVGGRLTKKAVPAQPEKNIVRIQGEVWLALAARLEGVGLTLDKIRHQAGYEVDGVIRTAEGPVLLEIKTGQSAADVYEGVGQLLLYASMLELDGYRKVLLLSFAPSAPLVQAAMSCGIEVYSYESTAEDTLIEVVFQKEFLVACGVPPEA